MIKLLSTELESHLYSVNQQLKLGSDPKNDSRTSQVGFDRFVPFNSITNDPGGATAEQLAALGLGIHVTLDLGGVMRFGPDVERTDVLDYTPNEGQKSKFAAAIKNYFPELREDDLEIDFAGIRPKTSPPGEPNDFVIDDLSSNGIDNSVHLFGIESPGLTCSLAIAEHVVQRFPQWA